jgi:chromosome segregation ATPase
VSGDRGRVDEERVDELLRVNRELAAEIRDLTAGRRAAPRSGQLPAARGVAKLQAERDRLAAEREALAAELAAREAERDHLREHGEELARQIGEQARRIEGLSHEVERLRGGLAGILRRLRARLLLRR